MNSSIIRVMHPNGYTAIRYGVSSVSVIDKENIEVFHSGYYFCTEEDDLMKLLEEVPELIQSGIDPSFIRSAVQ